jgi:hypothetical protein
MCIILTNSQDEKHCLSTLENNFQMSQQNIICFAYYNDKTLVVIGTDCAGSRSDKEDYKLKIDLVTGM